MNGRVVVYNRVADQGAGDLGRHAGQEPDPAGLQRGPVVVHETAVHVERGQAAGDESAGAATDVVEDFAIDEAQVASVSHVDAAAGGGEFPERGLVVVDAAAFHDDRRAGCEHAAARAEALVVLECGAPAGDVEIAEAHGVLGGGDGQDPVIGHAGQDALLRIAGERTQKQAARDRQRFGVGPVVDDHRVVGGGGVDGELDVAEGGGGAAVAGEVVAPRRGVPDARKHASLVERAHQAAAGGARQARRIRAQAVVAGGGVAEHGIRADVLVRAGLVRQAHVVAAGVVPDVVAGDGPGGGRGLPVDADTAVAGDDGVLDGHGLERLGDFQRGAGVVGDGRAGDRAGGESAEGGVTDRAAVVGVQAAAHRQRGLGDAEFQAAAVAGDLAVHQREDLVFLLVGAAEMDVARVVADRAADERHLGCVEQDRAGQALERAVGGGVVVRREFQVAVAPVDAAEDLAAQQGEDAVRGQAVVLERAVLDLAVGIVDVVHAKADTIVDEGAVADLDEGVAALLELEDVQVDGRARMVAELAIHDDEDAEAGEAGEGVGDAGRGVVFEHQTLEMGRRAGQAQAHAVAGVPDGESLDPRVLVLAGVVEEEPVVDRAADIDDRGGRTELAADDDRLAEGGEVAVAGADVRAGHDDDVVAAGRRRVEALLDREEGVARGAGAAEAAGRVGHVERVGERGGGGQGQARQGDQKRVSHRSTSRIGRKEVATAWTRGRAVGWASRRSSIRLRGMTRSGGHHPAKT